MGSNTRSWSSKKYTLRVFDLPIHKSFFKTILLCYSYSFWYPLIWLNFHYLIWLINESLSYQKQANKTNKRSFIYIHNYNIDWTNYKSMTLCISFALNESITKESIWYISLVHAIEYSFFFYLRCDFICHTHLKQNTRLKLMPFFIPFMISFYSRKKTN